MTITIADLKIFQSERMTDNSDGGGRMTANAIISGTENQIFDDVTDVDRAAGDVSIRKVYAAVTSANTDKYLDAGVVIFKEPVDPNVTVAAFSTDSFYDQRSDLKSKLEQTITRGARWHGWLWGQHLSGQRAIVLWQRSESELPVVGSRLELVAKAGTVEQYSQYVWITRVQDQLRTIYTDTSSLLVREVTCEIAEPLTGDYTGSEPTKADPVTSTLPALVYSTRYNAEAVPLFSIRPTVSSAAINDFSIQVDSLTTTIIPTSLIETALPDVNPAGDSPVLIAGNDSTINFTTTTECIKPSVSLYCGTGIYPGALSIAVSGSTITDLAGKALLSGTQIGEIDYGNGIITWNSACPNYSSSSKVITFKPAARPSRVSDTAHQSVTIGNRGYVWTMTLSPIPAPQTLKVSYKVNNSWYVLNDLGNGALSGVDSSYGAGLLNFSTGTCTITTGALPDVGSDLLYSWGTPVIYNDRSSTTVPAPIVRGVTSHLPVARLTAVLSWTDGETTYSLSDNPAGDGRLLGTGGVGGIDYSSGEWWVQPDVLPTIGTEFAINYQYGTATTVVETFTGLSSDEEGDDEIVLTGGPILPGSLRVSWDIAKNVWWAYINGIGADTVMLDDGIGGLFGDMASIFPVLPYYSGNSGLLFRKAGVGTANYATGVLSLPVAKLADSAVKASFSWHYTPSGWTYVQNPLVSVEPVSASFIKPESTVTVRYTPAGSLTTASDVHILNQIDIDLTPGYGERITAGSVRFILGGSTYVDTAGQVYRNPSPTTGAGSLSGSVDRSSGIVRLSEWTTGINTVSLQSLITELSGHAVDSVSFRTPTNPIRTGSLQLRYQLIDGTVKIKTIDDSGILEDTDCTVLADYQSGVVHARFGRWRIDADLTPEEKLETWYDPLTRVDFSGTLKIWEPQQVLADSILYNAVAQTTLPPDSTLLGINAARLPPDGKALVFSAGRLVLVHHTDTFAEATLSPTQALDCGRVRLYRVAIEDAGFQRLPDSFFTVNRELGIVTMAPDLDLTGYTGPYQIIHTVADLARLTAVDINGTLSLNKPLSHAYPADESRVSGVLFAGTLQARVTNLFAQSTWTSVWSDTLIGSAPLAQYNNTSWPIVVSNLGAYPDRFLIQFTSSTAFNVIGEKLGVIGTGTTSVDCAPVNSLSGQPYFTIPYQGWGTGWSTGNCVRFNLISAAYPVDLIRAVQPSTPTGQDPDSVEILLVGNVDA